MSKVKESALIAEFEIQVNNLLQKGYPKLAGMEENEFLEKLMPLKVKISGLNKAKETTEGKIDFVIVINSSFVPVEKSMPLISFKNKNGFVKLDPLESGDFKPIPSVKIPEGLSYLLVDIDRGEKTLNIPPSEAFEIIKGQNRFPLMVDEGIAIMTHYPDFLKKNNCFYMLASRANDLKIPAIWISEGRPKLGWCWNGNPHTWLGSASCKDRI